MARLKGVQTESLQFKVDYKSLEAHRSLRIEDASSIKYSVSLYLGEAIKTFNRDLYLPFTMIVETVPKGISFRVHGEIFVQDSPQTVNRWISSADGNPPRIWVQVYEEAIKALAPLVNYLRAPSFDELPHIKLSHTRGKRS